MLNRQTIGVISDTHGIFDSRIPALFAGVDHILHAGDIGRLEVYHQLRRLAPVTAVSGNVDEGILPLEVKPEAILEFQELRIFMMHILGHPSRLSGQRQEQIDKIHPRIVVFGHSHQPFLEEQRGILFFNPGSAGPQRFSLPRSLGLLEIKVGKVRGRLIEL